jgi:predicted metalloprotease with PDZ domain
MFLLSVCLSLAVAAPAATPAPAPSSQTPIQLSVDAREVTRKRIHAQLTLPVAPGPVTLAYPKWIPGEHGPTGPIVNLTGLELRAGGHSVAWRRDPTDVFLFHADVPAGAKTLDVSLDFLVPSGGDFTAGRSASDALALLSWNTVLLYPVGPPSDAILFAATLRPPAGWSHASALVEAGHDSESITFAPVSLTRLVDSPVLLGRHLQRIVLGSGEPGHEIDVAADSPAALAFKPEWKAAFDRLPEQALGLFGARHYGSYRWLLSLSDHVEHFGLEHHESSDDRLGERTFEKERGRRRLAGLLCHEYVHSWNGKFRRPADIATPDYQHPMRTSLLWVYEGLTQYLGVLLPARSGLWSPQEFRENLAVVAARLDGQAGRRWRPLEDTATAAQVLYGAPSEGESSRRGVDFYDESILIWLEADVILRRASQGQRSMDDFCHRFHGGAVGPYVVKPYGLDEVVSTLNALAPYDWRGFFAERVERVAPRAPLGGVTGSGWTLTFSEEPNTFLKDREDQDKELDESSSIGVWLREDGRLKDVVPDMPAAKAGLAAGMQVVAVNGRRYTADRLRDALSATRSGTPIELLAQSGDDFHSHRLEYGGGLRYPHLVRDEGQPDLLASILAPRTP